MLIPPDTYIHSFDSTVHPRTNREILAMVTWAWSENPDSDANVEQSRLARRFAAVHGMLQDEPAQLVRRDGTPTRLSLRGSALEVLSHPLADALLEPVPFPTAPDMGFEFGTVLAHSRQALWLYVTDPLPAPRPPSMSTLLSLLSADRSAVGVALMQVEADDNARARYPRPPSDGRTALRERIESEPDSALRAGLKLAFGISDTTMDAGRRLDDQ